MMNSWTIKQIKDIGKVITGKTPRTAEEDNFGDEYLFLTPSDMDGRKKIDNTDRKLSEKGAISVKSCKIYANSICVSCIGWQMGKVVIIAKEGFTNQQINTIIPNNSVIPDFVYYNFSLRREELMTLASGGTRTPILKKSLFEKLEILLPPLQTQQKIASILSAYDELIENNTRQIKILEEMAQLIYREWFVKFKFPNHENVAMIDSELGLIPEGWEVKKLGDIANIIRGRSYRSSELVKEGGISFLNLKCINRDGGFRYDGLKRYNGKYKKNQIVYSGNILIAITDMTQERRVIARAARVPITQEDFYTFSMDLVKLELTNDNIENSFIYAMLRFSDFANKVKQYANGANVLHLSPDRISEFKFILPNLDLRNNYAHLCEDIYTKCDLLFLENINLRKTRDLLLPKLISGEIDVEALNIKIGGEVE
ncbi:MAG: restriction endonuclease subunit S [Microcystaceae cyanobacterium]